MADFQGLLLEHAEKPAGSRFADTLAEPSPQQDKESVLALR